MNKTTFVFAGLLMSTTLVAFAQNPNPPMGRGGDIRFEVNLNQVQQKKLRPAERFCLGTDIFNAANKRLVEMDAVRLRMKAESSFDRDGNYLDVTDESGRPLRYVSLRGDRDSRARIPFMADMIEVEMMDRSRDLCIAGTRQSRFDNFSISFVPSRFGPGPGPRPPEPIIYEGGLGNLSEEGEIFGWACNSRSRAPLNVALYANGRLVGTMPAAINIDADGRNRGNYGRPSVACGPVSGFRFRLDLDREAGRNINLELRAAERRGEETPIARRDIRAPVLTLPEGIFNIREVFYFSSAGAYCHIPNPDQLTARRSMGYANLGSYENLPTRMRDGRECADVAYPRSLFNATRSSDPNKIYLSDGTRSYCHVQHPGMLDHVKAVTGLRNVTQYAGLPASMRQDGVCKVAGFFRIRGGEAVYESKGGDTFCWVRSSAYVGNSPVFDYQDFPLGVTNAGFCPY